MVFIFQASNQMMIINSKWLLIILALRNNDSWITKKNKLIPWFSHLFTQNIIYYIDMIYIQK